MLTEAEQIALMLEQIGRRALAYCKSLPEEALHWPPPLPETPSIFALATQITEEVDTWILIPVGGKVATSTHVSTVPLIQSVVPIWTLQNSMRAGSRMYRKF